jgi:SAM-dependent methyltransferase
VDKVDEQSYATLHRLGQGHWWYRGARSVYRALLRRYAAGLSGPILDLGCGAGGNLEMARKWGAVIGLDAWRPALTLCPSGVAVLTQGVAEALPFRDGAFGLVTALGLIEHVADDVGVLREARRVCQPGGTVLLLTSAFRFLWSRHDEANCHLRRYTARELRRKAEDAGLRVRHISYLNFFLFPVAAAVRLVQRLLPRRGEPRLDMFPVPEPFNSVLAGLLALEGWLMQWVRLPWGVSLVAVLER